MAEPLVPSEGWGVLHLFHKVDHVRAAAASPGDVKHLVDVLDELADATQLHLFSVLGHKADTMTMLLEPDVARLRAQPARVELGPVLGKVGVGDDELARRGQPVAARAADLLVVLLDRLGRAPVHDVADVGLVDAHAERDRRDDDHELADESSSPRVATTSSPVLSSASLRTLVARFLAKHMDKASSARFTAARGARSPGTEPFSRSSLSALSALTRSSSSEPAASSGRR